jgi:hypothetical protein
MRGRQSRRPVAQVRNSESDQSSNATVDSGVNSSRSETGPNSSANTEVSSSRSRKGLDGPSDAEVSKSQFAQGPNENAMIEDEERVFMQPSGC